MNRLAWVGMAMVAMALGPAAGCRSEGRSDKMGHGAVDTTKDVYTDNEAPKEQIRVVNGVEERIPWDRVPEGSRWVFQMDDRGGYKYRSPIVRFEVTSVDKEGGHVSPERGYRVRAVEHTLNPKYTRYTLAGSEH